MVQLYREIGVVMRIAFVQEIKLKIFIFWNKEFEINLMICHNKLVYTGSAVMENEKYSNLSLSCSTV
jgi:hypothetical protein